MMIIKVADLLSIGRKNRVSSASLRRATGLSARALREQIRKERRAGALIMSDTTHGGFWLSDPDDQEELRTYYKRVSGAALDALETLKPVRERLKGL